MRVSPIVLSALLLSSLAISVDAQSAKTPPAGRGQPPGAMATEPRYDVATVTTVDGVLIAIDSVLPMSGMPGRGVHATLKTSTATLPVMIGPLQYLAGQKMRLAKGDRVTVTGSKVVRSTVPSILAQRIVKGTDTLKLRDDNGMPLWRGMRMGTKP